MDTTLEVNEILKKLPPAPAGVTRWIHKDVIERSYLIYNKKTDEAVCTRCGHKFRARTTQQYSFKAKALKDNNITLAQYVRWADREAVTHFGDWLDYLRDCKELGLDLRKKRILLPENFMGAHAEYSEQVYIEKKKKTENEMARIAKDYNFEIRENGLVLKIAGGQIDLNRESAGLNHCVRTYGKKIAEGRSLIYFIRQEAAPDKPYYTLEITPNGQFVQCRGKGNCNMTPEVMAFKDMVINEFNKRFRKGAKTA